MSQYNVVVVVLSACLIVSSIEAAERDHFYRLKDVARNNNFSSYSYDELHQLALLDQIESYIKPIKWLETRTFKSLNGLYDFCFDPRQAGFESRWFERELVEACQPEANYYRMPVPSAFNEIVTNATAKNYMGWMWYQTSFTWPSPVGSAYWDSGQKCDDSNWILQVESINYLSVAWLQIVRSDNVIESHLIGAHVGGHLPVTMNVSSILNNITSSGTQMRLTIAVSNMLTANTIPSGQMLNMTSAVGRPYFRFQPDFDFFHFAGIMGDVQLIRLPRYFIEQVELIDTQATSDGGLTVRLSLNEPIHSWHTIHYSVIAEGIISNYVWRPLDYPGRVDVGDPKCRHHDICSNDSPCEYMNSLRREWPLARGRVARVQFSLLVGDYATQHENTIPYDDLVEIKLVKRANMTRILQETSTKQQLQGFGMHHEQLFSGRTMSLAAIMKDLYLLKQMGANVIRTSHYPYSRAYLDACDELGIMVIAECPAVGLSTFDDIKLLLHKQILLEMMQRDHNHPSIVMWSLANEPESQLSKARKYFKQLVEYARRELRSFTIEANRPLTAAIAQSHVDDKIGDLFDVLMINRYYGWYDCTGLIGCVGPSLVKSLGGWAAKYGPNKPLVVSEFGADTVAGLHSSLSEIFSEEYQRDLIVEYERVFDELVANKTAASENGQTNNNSINFLGAMIWNFADFSTHESLLRVGGNKKGIFTRSREPKLAAQSVERIYQSRMGPIITRANV